MALVKEWSGLDVKIQENVEDKRPRKTLPPNQATPIYVMSCVSILCVIGKETIPRFLTNKLA